VRREMGRAGGQRWVSRGPEGAGPGMADGGGRAWGRDGTERAGRLWGRGATCLGYSGDASAAAAAYKQREVEAGLKRGAGVRPCGKRLPGTGHPPRRTHPHRHRDPACPAPAPGQRRGWRGGLLGRP